MIKTIRGSWHEIRQHVEVWVQTGSHWISQYWPLTQPDQHPKERGHQTEPTPSVSAFSVAEPGRSSQYVSPQATPTAMDGVMKPENTNQEHLIPGWEAVDILWQMGAFLVLSGHAKSRQSAFQKASHYVEEHLSRWPDISAEELAHLSGWPEEVKTSLLMLERGEIPSWYRELQDTLGEHATDLLRVRGIGLDKAISIRESLGIQTLDQLWDAAKSGVLLQVKGFGAKSVERLKQEIEQALTERQERVQRIEQARGKAQVKQVTHTKPNSSAFAPIVDSSGRDVMDLLRCPSTHQSGFVRDASEAVLPTVERRYSIAHGVIDMMGQGHEAHSVVQLVMENQIYSQWYETVFRPNLTRLVTRRSVRDDIALSLDMLQLHPNWAVLDVACGPGNYTRAIAHSLDAQTGIAVGLDVSWAMLRKATQHREHRNFSNLHFVRGSALHLPFQNECFNAVHCTAALHLFDEPARALQEFHRVTSPQGRLVVGTFLQSRFFPFRLAQRLGGSLTGFHWFSLEDLEILITKAGYTVERTEIDGLAVSIAAIRSN